ncbi:MAG: ABC transporter ATP-binding protein [Armatimonadetes bacterium CG07_land_8_20_14_0_80_59_28]|nr:MAG: ABC transporter ATP-binding protein [Armatimonadetes bacterium CG07_land_8_20_14_0_80_59_28]PIY40551.1 MAG: ABC transporter ATP-binding protein [Armatimonadetes bacterium CG_4_10_14_3_um_filter_59_10]
MQIVIDHLVKTYEGGIRALDGVQMQIGDGVFGLLGPNGSGKTTLMRIIATLLEPTSGAVSIDGNDVRRRQSDVRKLLGYLPQEFGLYPSLTAWEFLDYMALLYNVEDTRQRERIVNESLERTNLTHLRDRKVGTFSGGMKQRLGIAQAILNSPKLLIVDEPTSGLDPEERIRIRSLLAELGGDRVIILSTHIVADIEAVADSIGVLHLGKVKFQGTPEELLRSIAGKTWQIEVEREELRQIKEKLQITGVFRSIGGVEIRVVAASSELGGSLPHIRARQVEPTLEDAYIHLMGGSAVG